METIKYNPSYFETHYPFIADMVRAKEETQEETRKYREATAQGKAYQPRERK